MEINALLTSIRELAASKNFGLKPEEVNVAEKFALIHTEVSEAFEAYRRNNFSEKDGVKEEMADILIRTLHLCIIFDVDVEKEISQKLKTNKERTWDHPNEDVSKLR